MKNKKTTIFLQRQIEMQLLKRVSERLADEFGKDQVLNNIRTTIKKIAFESGRKYKESHGDNSLFIMAEYWNELAENGSLIIKDFSITDSRLSFNVTHCKYADYYKQIEAEELGEALSCCRDKAFLKGVSNKIKLSRSKTILEGNPICKFTYECDK